MISRGYSYVKKSRVLKRAKLTSSSSSSCSGEASNDAPLKNQEYYVNLERRLERSKNETLLSDLNQDQLSGTGVNSEGITSETYDEAMKIGDNGFMNMRTISIDGSSHRISHNTVDTSSSAITDESNSVSNDPKYSDSEVQMNQNDSQPAGLRDKLQDWAINNIFILTNKAITELLLVLRDEGHT